MEALVTKSNKTCNINKVTTNNEQISTKYTSLCSLLEFLHHSDRESEATSEQKGLTELDLRGEQIANKMITKNISNTYGEKKLNNFPDCPFVNI